MLQLGKAKKRRRGRAQRQLDGAEPFFDLGPGLLLVHFLAVQVRMRPSRGADAMAGRRHLFENFGVVGRVLADREEHRLGAFIRERFEHGGRVYRPGTVVEGQHDFIIRQEVDQKAADCLSKDRDTLLASSSSAGPAWSAPSREVVGGSMMLSQAE